MSPPARALRILSLAVAFALLATSWWNVSRPALRAPGSAAVDFLPLWLGAGLVLDGDDPTAADLAEARFREERLPQRPGGFYSYYPPTASLLASPLRALSFATALDAWRLVCALSTPLGVVFAVLAGFASPGPRVRWEFALSVSFLVASVAILARPARIVLPTGQPGPLVVVFSGAALLFLARGRFVPAAVVAALGAALKLVPGVVLGVLLLRRQWAAVAVSIGVMTGLGSILLALGVPLHPIDWAGEVGAFVGRGPLPSWRTEPPWLQALWWARGWGVGVGFSAALAVAWRRGLDDSRALDLSVLALASVGVVLAGSHHYHEALVLLPALAHVLAWPAQAPRSRLAWLAAGGLVAACLLLWPAFAPRGRPDSLHWLAIGGVGWAGCMARAVSSRLSGPGFSVAPPVGAYFIGEQRDVGAIDQRGGRVAGFE